MGCIHWATNGACERIWCFVVTAMRPWWRVWMRGLVRMLVLVRWGRPPVWWPQPGVTVVMLTALHDKSVIFVARPTSLFCLSSGSQWSVWWAWPGNMCTNPSLSGRGLCHGCSPSHNPYDCSLSLSRSQSCSHSLIVVTIPIPTTICQSLPGSTPAFSLTDCSLCLCPIFSLGPTLCL